MLKYAVLALVAAAFTAAGLSLLEGDDARSATTGHISLAVPAFRGVHYSKHNQQGGGSNACGSFVQLDDPSQRDATNPRGELAGGTDGNWRGSFVHSVNLPHGATPTGVSIIAHDNDGDFDVHVFLMRKQITDGLDPAKSVYTGLAHARTDGAELNILQRATDASVKGGTINNLKYEYFAEVIICTTTEPYAVQISYTTP